MRPELLIVVALHLTDINDADVVEIRLGHRMSSLYLACLSAEADFLYIASCSKAIHSRVRFTGLVTLIKLLVQHSVPGSQGC